MSKSNVSNSKEQTLQQQNENQEPQIETPEEPGQEEETEVTRKKPRFTFEHKYRRMRLILEASTTDQLLISNAERFGYSQERITEGSVIFDQLTAAREIQKDKQAAWRALHNAFKIKEKVADDTMKYLLQVGRLAFRDNDTMLNALELNETPKKTYSEKVVQQIRFFTKILTEPGAVEEMAKYNMPLEELQAGKVVVEEALAADTLRDSARADAQVATEAKDKQFKLMKIWFSDYLAVMRIALKDNPQLQEKLGIVVPNQS
ncbi:MAG: hypothetical protein GY757_54805 [bacterium]|nr:hypothetical protein [bacterium]